MTLLSQLAEQRFGSLTAAEQQLLEVAETGAIADCGRLRPTGDNWSEEQTIRAALLRWLCIDHTAAQHVDPHGIDVDHAHIDEQLDLVMSS